jgi:hypothetical protein
MMLMLWHFPVTCHVSMLRYNKRNRGANFQDIAIKHTYNTKEQKASAEKGAF